jgi:hypothetical protein
MPPTPIAMAPIVNISASSAPVKAMGDVAAVLGAVEGEGVEEGVTTVGVVDTAVVGVTVIGWVQGP